MTILDDLAGHARARVEAAKRLHPLDELKALSAAKGKADHGERPFEAALATPDLSFICEVKRASPSKGLIAEDFPYVQIAKDYEAAGADAISCLTEPRWFLGSDEIFKQIHHAQDLPMLRKDFTVDEYQLFEAHLMGASCVLLICSLLDSATIERYLGICDELALSALVEAHDADEVRRAVAAGARIVGVNNRNLKDFSVDFENAKRLRELIPSDVVYVAESGVTGPSDVAEVRATGADAVLVGEALMRAHDKKAMLQRMRRAASDVASGTATGEGR